jgi:hypothetical protein
MNKHTPLTKITKNKRSKTPTGRNPILKRKDQNTKKSKVPLIPAQKNKYHYNYKKSLASTWLNKQRRIEETLTTFL